MENWYALHEMSRQVQRERQLEAQKLSQIRQFREFDIKNRQNHGLYKMYYYDGSLKTSG